MCYRIPTVSFVVIAINHLISVILVATVHCDPSSYSLNCKALSKFERH